MSRKVSDLSSARVNFKGKGVAGTATAGATTNIDYTLPEERLLTGLDLIVSGAVNGDKCNLEVLTGGDVVVATYAEDWYIDSTEVRQTFQSQYPARIPTGYKLRVKFISTGGANVSVKINYYLHKIVG